MGKMPDVDPFTGTKVRVPYDGQKIEVTEAEVTELPTRILGQQSSKGKKGKKGA